MNHYSILSWGTCLDLAPSITLCDRAFITRYPQIMGNQEERAPAKSRPCKHTLSEEGQCGSADSSRGSRAARHGLGYSIRQLVIQGVLTYMYIWLNHMLTLHVVTAADDTPCSRTVSILRDLNNVP
jgi:hypothetical protein